MEKFEILLEKLEGIKKYYYKGFGNAICGCNNFIEHFCVFKKADDFEKFNNEINPLLNLYDKIPFSGLHGKEEFYPLFLVNNLLRDYNLRAQNFFNYKSKGETDILKLGRTIVDVGGLYHNSLDETLKEIRLISGHEGFEFSIADYLGNVFYF